MLYLKPEDLERIKVIAEQTYPHECCGLLVGSAGAGFKRVSRVVEAQNQRSDSAANRYLIAPEFLLEWEKRLRGSRSQILGFFHSHPDVPARPSRYDRDHAWPWYSYLIASVRRGKTAEVLSWLLMEDRSSFEPEEWELESQGS